MSLEYARELRCSIAEIVEPVQDASRALLPGPLCAAVVSSNLLRLLNGETRTLRGDAGVTAGSKAVFDRAEDLDVVARLLLDEDVLSATARLEREGMVDL